MSVIKKHCQSVVAWKMGKYINTLYHQKLFHINNICMVFFGWNVKTLISRLHGKVAILIIHNSNFWQLWLTKIVAGQILFKRVLHKLNYPSAFEQASVKPSYMLNPHKTRLIVTPLIRNNLIENGLSFKLP